MSVELQNDRTERRRKRGIPSARHAQCCQLVYLSTAHSLRKTETEGKKLEFGKTHDDPNTDSPSHRNCPMVRDNPRTESEADTQEQLWQLHLHRS